MSFINYQKLADMNNSDGIFMLGYCYEHGIDVKKNKNKAKGLKKK